jgi:hypothetical protein
MGKRAEVTRKSDIDIDPDLSHLGFYTDTHEEGAINAWESDPDTRVNPGRWFVPANPEYGAEDLKRHEAFNRYDWTYAVLTVTVSCGGITESACLCGVEDEYGENAWHEEVYKELRAEAFDLWRASVEKMRETWCLDGAGQPIACAA